MPSLSATYRLSFCPERTWGRFIRPIECRWSPGRSGKAPSQLTHKHWLLRSTGGYSMLTGCQGSTCCTIRPATLTCLRLMKTDGTRPLETETPPEVNLISHCQILPCRGVFVVRRLSALLKLRLDWSHFMFMIYYQSNYLQGQFPRVPPLKKLIIVIEFRNTISLFVNSFQEKLYRLYEVMKRQAEHRQQWTLRMPLLTWDCCFTISVGANMAVMILFITIIYLVVVLLHLSACGWQFSHWWRAGHDTYLLIKFGLLSMLLVWIPAAAKGTSGWRRASSRKSLVSPNATVTELYKAMGQI